MQSIKTFQAQRGLTLALGLIMLMVTTLIVVTGFQMTQTNLIAVSNMQFNNEVLAAANMALENQISSDFFVNPAASTFSVDINNDTHADYQVNLSIPSCVKAQKHDSDCEATGTCTSDDVDVGSEVRFTTTWELKAAVTDATTGASITIVNGVRALLDEDQFNDYCK